MRTLLIAVLFALTGCVTVRYNANKPECVGEVTEIAGEYFCTVRVPSPGEMP